MSATEVRITSEQESREVAEQARQKEWEGRAFIRELYLGGLPLDLVHPFPMETADRPEFRKFSDRIGEQTKRTVELSSKVDPDILGGIVLRVGNVVLDASIRNRLEQLRKQVARA